jgi:hypothetical protein
MIRANIFVAGRRCRSQELMFPSAPVNGFACTMPYLCVYAEMEIDVFNVHSADWVQTINLKKVRSYSKSFDL